MKHKGSPFWIEEKIRIPTAEPEQDLKWKEREWQAGSFVNNMLQSLWGKEIRIQRIRPLPCQNTALSQGACEHVYPHMTTAQFL